MAMRHCPACGRDYRTGGTVCVVLAPAGASRQTVCRRCAARGVTVVAAAKGAPAVVSDDAAVKAMLSDMLRVRRQLRTYALAARKGAEGAEDECDGAFHLGRAEGFEGALRALETEVGGQ